jgi:LPXTG-site transpeptidase (sortase) family protein
MTKQRRKYLIIMVVAILVIAIDIGILVRHKIDMDKQQAFINSQMSMLGSRNVPSSVKPTAKAIAAYEVSPNLPKYLIIPSINVKARIVELYTNPSDQIEAPDNIFDVGWYNKSSLPGDPGATFIDGHVSSWTANGIFYNLKKLKQGDSIQIIRGDNKVFTYIVSKIQVYDATSVNMNQVLSPINSALSGLNLMTCTGKVIPNTSEFNQRLVVYSELKT